MPDGRAWGLVPLPLDCCADARRPLRWTFPPLPPDAPRLTSTPPPAVPRAVPPCRRPRLQDCLDLAVVLPDRRNLQRVIQTLADLLRQHVCLPALGYFECNDSPSLLDLPLLRLPPGQDSDRGPGPSSRPTLHRCGNWLDQKRFEDMETVFVQVVIDRQLAAAAPFRQEFPCFEVDNQHGSWAVTARNRCPCLLPRIPSG